jgi:transcriptional regulator with XRE-family HTH domain
MPRSFQSRPQSLFGRRLREVRSRAGIPQDHLGVLIGLEEGSSSARISRYESGIHEPPLATAEKLAGALGVPLAYFYCDDEQLAALILGFAALHAEGRARACALVEALSAEPPG